jgi:murein DD-endopeptidase MepM/ murein hydrolase activator NlpD
VVYLIYLVAELTTASIMSLFSKNSKIASIYGLSFGKSILFCSLTISLFMAPNVTQASIISFISDIFAGQNVSAEAESFIESNSQNMDLLEAAVSPELAVKTSSELTVVGEEALLPEVGPSTSAPDTVDNSNGQISVYIVRSGDTLAGIAKMFDVTVNTVLWANDLSKNSALKVGQNLVILPISGVMHTVASGDTLSTIAKKYGGDIAEIADINDLSVSAKLAIGDEIMIPDGEMSFSTRPSTSGSSANSKLVSAGGPEYAGYYQKPFLVGRKTQGLHGYNGVDYGMPIGTQIFASAAGTVLISKSTGYNGGYGGYVVIKHNNGTQTLYSHLSNTTVSVGQTVTQGQLIGYSGNTGKSTGPHLHFEVRGAKNPF